MKPAFRSGRLAQENGKASELCVDASTRVAIDKAGLRIVCRRCNL
jgi:hypothetical protein